MLMSKLEKNFMLEQNSKSKYDLRAFWGFWGNIFFPKKTVCTCVWLFVFVAFAVCAHAQEAPLFMRKGKGPPKNTLRNKIIKKKSIKLLNTKYFKFKNIPSGYIVKKMHFLIEGTFEMEGGLRFQVVVNGGVPYRANLVDGKFSYWADLSTDNNGVNEIDVAIAGKNGVLGWERIKLVYILSAQKRLEELGKIEFTYPPYGYKIGSWEWSLWVEGRVDIPDIKTCKLFVNDEAREIKVTDGRFREKVSTIGEEKLLLQIGVTDKYGRKMISTYHVIYGR